MSKMRSIVLAAALAAVFTACPEMTEFTELPWYYVPGLIEKDCRVKTAIAIESDGDPRVALNYRMGSSTGAYYFDYVVLCSAKMRVNTSGPVPVFTLNTDDLDHILNYSAIYLNPLRLRGIKIILEVINDNNGFTFANLPYSMQQQFAKSCRDAVVRYGLHGLSFKDINGDDPANNLFAYPDNSWWRDPGDGAPPPPQADSNQPVYYDTHFDDFPAFWSGNSASEIGNRIAISNVVIPKNRRELTDTSITNQLTTIIGSDRIDYFWHMGGASYGNFLSYFRELDPWQTDISNIAVIGNILDAPLWVWETGFGGGHTGDHTNEQLMSVQLTGGDLGNQKSYLTEFITDWYRDGLTFTGITANVVNVIICPNTPRDGFGWEDSGVGVLETKPDEYCPGILDLSEPRGLTNTDIETFSRKFAQGNEEMLINGDPNPFWGNPYGLLYYTNVGPGDEAKMSITSRIVFGGRNDDENGILINLKEDGPAIINNNVY